MFTARTAKRFRPGMGRQGGGGEKMGGAGIFVRNVPLLVFCENVIDVV